MGGSNETSSQQQTTTALPANQQRNVDTLLQGAFDYFNSGGREFFPGDIVADFNPNQVGGQNSLVNFAGGVGTDLVGDTIAANKMLLDPGLLDPRNQPGFGGTLDEINRRSTQQLTENILPQIRGGAQSAGQFGGTPGEIGEALASSRSEQNRDALTSGLTLGAYGQGLNAINQGINNSQGVFNLGTRPGQIQTAVGDAQQNQAQAEIGANVARHDFQQNEPINMLELLRQLTGQAGTFGGTTTQTGTTETSGSGINQLLGAIMAGGAVAAPFIPGVGPALTAGAGVMNNNAINPFFSGGLQPPPKTAAEMFPFQS